MAITLTGIFDDYSEARQACDKLEREGIDKGRIELTSDDSAATTRSTAPAEDRRGFFAKLFGLDQPDDDIGHYSEAVRRGSSIVTVSLADESRADEVSDILDDCGAIDIKQRVEQWKAGGYAGYDPKAAPYTRDQIASERETFKVMQEDLKVGKRAVEGGGVRVHRRVSEKPVSEQVNLREEKAVIERRPADRAASSDEIDSFGQGEKDLVIRETSEEPVVSKTARVVEEVSVGKKASQRTETVKDKLRRTDVDVEDLGDVPTRNRMAGDRLRPYSGPERRLSTGMPYAGVERRSVM